MQCDNNDHQGMTQQAMLNQVQEEIELLLGWSNCAISVLSLTDEDQKDAVLKTG